MVDIPLLIRDLVLFLLVALVVNFITEKLAVPYTLGLVIVGLGIGLVGLAPEAQLSPDLVLFVLTLFLCIVSSPSTTCPALSSARGWAAILNRQALLIRSSLPSSNWRPSCGGPSSVASSCCTSSPRSVSAAERCGRSKR